jgi:small multidrug resistance pump
LKYWIFLIIAIFCEVFATSALKSSNGFSKIIPSSVVIIGYGLSFYFLSLTLKVIPMGIAYAVWAGLGIVLITLASWLIYGQNLDFPAFLGLLLIISGVVVINLFSKVSGH